MKKYLVLFLIFAVSTPVLAAAISGRVTDDFGRNVSGVDVTWDGGSTQTAADGTFDFSLTSTSSARVVTFSKSGFSEDITRRVLAADDTPVSMNLIMTRLAVDGVVRDRSGRPVRGVEMSLVASGNTTSTTTNIGGYYSFEEVTPGVYSLAASKIGYISTSSSVRVTNARVSKNLTLTRLQVYGRVLDSGSPIPGSRVVLTDGVGNLVGGAVTDSNGMYAIDALAGDFALHLMPDPDKQIVSETVSVGDSASEQENISLVENSNVVTLVASSDADLRRVLQSAAGRSRDVIIYINASGRLAPNGGPYIVKKNPGETGRTLIAAGTGRVFWSTANAIFDIRAPEVMLKGLLLSGGGSVGEIITIRDGATRLGISNCSIIDSSGSKPVFTVTASQSVIVGNTITSGISVSAENVMVYDNVFDLSDASAAINHGVLLTVTAINAVVDENIIRMPAADITAIESDSVSTIKNNTIVGSRNNGTGIDTTGLGGIVAFSNTVSNCATGISAAGTEDRIVSNTVENCTTGIAIDDANGTLISRNTVTGGQGNGISETNGRNNFINYNIVRNNNNGIVSDTSRGTSIDSNTSTGNDEHGIVISRSASNSASSNNTTTRNSGTGLYLKDNTAAHYSVSDTSSGNARGVVIEGDVAPTFSRLQAQDNTNQDIDDDSTSGSTFARLIADESEFDVRPELIDSYPGETALPQIEKPEIGAFVVLLNAAKFVVNLQAKAAGHYPLVVQGVQGQALAGSIDTNGRSSSATEVPLRVGLGYLKGSLRTMAVTDSGNSEPVLTSPTIVGSKMQLTNQNISGRITRNVTYGRPDRIKYSITNLGNNIDTFTLSHSLVGEGKDDWDVSISIQGMDVTPQTRTTGFTTAQLAAQTGQARGGRRNGEIILEPTDPRAGPATLVINATSGRTSDNVETAYIDCNVIKASRTQPKSAMPIPGRGQVTFRLHGESLAGASAFAGGGTAGAWIYIYDLSGKVVLQENVTLTSDYSSAELDTSSLGIGSYVYQVVIDGEVVSRGKVAITQ